MIKHEKIDYFFAIYDRIAPNSRKSRNLGNKHRRTELGMSTPSSTLCVASVDQCVEFCGIIPEPVESESNDSCGSCGSSGSDSDVDSNLAFDFDSEHIKVEGEAEPDPTLEELDSLLEHMVFVEDQGMLSRGIAVVYPTSIQDDESEEPEGFESWWEEPQTRETERWQKLMSGQPEVAAV